MLFENNLTLTFVMLGFFYFFGIFAAFRKLKHSLRKIIFENIIHLANQSAALMVT